MILIYGGIGSGKSVFAESYVMNYEGPRVYLATMKVTDSELEAKVAGHRIMREGKFLRTIELPASVDKADVSSDELVLLECLSNLLANEMFVEDELGNYVMIEGIHEKIFRDLCNLEKKCKELVIVGNDVFDRSKSYDEPGNKYIAELAALQNLLAVHSDEVIECIYGLAHRRLHVVF